MQKNYQPKTNEGPTKQTPNMTKDHAQRYPFPEACKTVVLVCVLITDSLRQRRTEQREDSLMYYQKGEKLDLKQDQK